MPDKRDSVRHNRTHRHARQAGSDRRTITAGQQAQTGVGGRGGWPIHKARPAQLARMATLCKNLVNAPVANVLDALHRNGLQNRLAPNPAVGSIAAQRIACFPKQPLASAALAQLSRGQQTSEPLQL
jgi:hypothetical protein